MDRDTLDSLDKETLIRLILSQADAIERLTGEVEALRADNAHCVPNSICRRRRPKIPTPRRARDTRPRARKARRPRESGASRTPARTARFIPIRRRSGMYSRAPASIAAPSFWIRPQFVCEAYDHIEIPPIVPHVTRVSLLGGACLCCARKFKAEPPQDMPKGSPFGPNLRALVIYLRFTQGIAFERLATLLPISSVSTSARARSSTSSTRQRMPLPRRPRRSARTPRWYDPAIRRDRPAGRQAELVAVVFHHDDSALFVAAPSRAKKVVADFLGDFRPDFWVSDRYGGQMGWATVNNQVCLAHLIRDVQYAIDAGDDIFAPELRHLLGRACRIGRRRERLADATLKTYAARLYTRLDELMRLVPAHEAGVKLQRVIKRTLAISLRLRDEPRHSSDQQRLRTRVASLRRVPKNHQWFPHRVGS